MIFAMSKYNLEASLQDAESKLIIFYNQLMTLFVIEGEREEIPDEPIMLAMTNYTETKNWEDTIRKYIQIANLLWDSLRVKISEEMLTPLDIYKLEQKLTSLALCYNGLSIAYKKMVTCVRRVVGSMKSETL